MEKLIDNIKTNLNDSDINKLVIVNSSCPWKRLEIQKDPKGWFILEGIAQNIDGIEEFVVSYLKISCGCNSDDLFNMYLNKELDWVQGESDITKLIVQKK